MARNELEAALDYILNRADESEFEVIVKAVERRHRDMRFTPGGGGSPKRVAGEMARSISEGVGANMEGLREIIRGYVEDIVRKAAPGIGEEELTVLLEHWGAGQGVQAGKAKAQGSLPPEALRSMVKQFVSFSTGAMPPSEQKYLWQEMPRWQEEYWKAFPPEIKALVDGLLKGKIASEQFWPAIDGLVSG